MNPVTEEVCAFLLAHDIPHRRYIHPHTAALTDCAWVSERIGAPIVKNYFLETRNRKTHALCLVRPEAKLRTADISKQAGLSRLSFGGDDALFALLRTRPGSVSPLGLMFDKENRVKLLVDEALTRLPLLAFHPCDNSGTVVLTHDAFFEQFLPAVRHGVTPVTVHDFL